MLRSPAKAGVQSRRSAPIALPRESFSGLDPGLRRGTENRGNLIFYHRYSLLFDGS